MNSTRIMGPSHVLLGRSFHIGVEGVVYRTADQSMPPIARRLYNCRPSNRQYVPCPQDHKATEEVLGGCLPSEAGTVYMR